MIDQQCDIEELLGATIQLSNPNFDPSRLLRIYHNLTSLTSEESEAILNTLNTVRQLSERRVDRSEVINEIECRVRDCTISGKNTLESTDYFMAYKNKRNENNVGISILDQNGQFVLIDEKARNILELRQSELKNKKLFSLVCQCSEERLRNKYSGLCLMSKFKQELELQLTIYSDRSRKKSLRLLQKSMYPQTQTKKAKKSQKCERQGNSERIIENNVDKQKELCNKYLKTISVRLMRINYQIQDDFVESIRNSQDLMLVSGYSPDCISQGVVCEISEVDKFEDFNLQDLLQDSYIRKHEQNWNKKISTNQKLGD